MVKGHIKDKRMSIMCSKYFLKLKAIPSNEHFSFWWKQTTSCLSDNRSDRTGELILTDLGSNATTVTRPCWNQSETLKITWFDSQTRISLMADFTKHVGESKQIFMKMNIFCHRNFQHWFDLTYIMRKKFILVESNQKMTFILPSAH